jgi:hypothetical protein
MIAASTKNVIVPRNDASVNKTQEKGFRYFFLRQLDQIERCRWRLLELKIDRFIDESPSIL